MFGRLDRLDINPAALAYFQRLSPPDRGRPLHLSPFGEAFKPFQISPGSRRGKIFTQIGFIDPKDPSGLDALPTELRAPVVHPAPAGKGLGLGRRLGILQISEAALQARGYDEIKNEIVERGGRILEARPERALVVRGAPNVLAALIRESFVEAALPYEPAFKIEPVTGTQQLVDRRRANKDELDILIKPWLREDIPDLQEELGRIAPDRVTLLEDGFTFRATVTVPELRRMARDERVRHLGEVPEYWLTSRFVFAEHPPTVQVGENEFTHAATPYWDAEVDGGGCGHCSVSIQVPCDEDSDCMPIIFGAPQYCVGADALECPKTDNVAPTIVAITDNGASVDAAALTSFLTPQPESSIAALISSGSHRKIAAYQVGGGETVTPLGSTCDSMLSGAQTHGNVVAGMIAGNASALGLEFQKNRALASFGDVQRINLDGAARGARLTIQDFGGSSQCTAAEILEVGNAIDPGVLTDRLNAAYDTGARLHVLPFGMPNWGPNGTTTAGIYNAAADELDTFLVNNLEYLAFVPVGNRGFSLINGRDLIPDFFDGESSAANDGAASFGTLLPQISPPATAKNIVAAGSTCEDVQTMFGAFNEEENVDNSSAKGPATAASLRMAPMMTGVGSDRVPTATGIGYWFWPPVEQVHGSVGGAVPYGMYTTQSKDNDQATDTNGVGMELAERAMGTSFGAASVASAAALIQDYFHQGFYPTGVRERDDRVDAVSGALIKAMLGAGTNFSEQLIGLHATAVGKRANDVQVSISRASIVTINVAGPSGRTGSTVIGNNQQGYGRVVASHVLPLADWPDLEVGSHYVPDAPADTLERAALGLLVWDSIATGEAPIHHATNPSKNHHFRVLDDRGAIRICLAWPDPPGDLLVNDLDLEVESPGPDGDLSTSTDNIVYDGNVYRPINQIVGQWADGRALTDPDRGDDVNSMECIHLFDDPDRNPATDDNQLRPGLWKVRVKLGSGGAVPGHITQVDDPDEDTDGDNRLSTAEDAAGDGDGLLDKGGQVYGLVVAGPVVVDKTQGSNPAGFDDFPQSIVRLDAPRYDCADAVRVRVLDPDADAGIVQAQLILEVLDTGGAVVDTEANLPFTAGTADSFTSISLPVRLISGPSGTAGNGILEGDTGYRIRAVYTDLTLNSRPAVARARIDCEPNFLGGVFVSPGQRDTQDLVYGGCDTDPYFDADEVLTYSVSVVNNDRFDEYTDVEATLATCSLACEDPSNASFVEGGTCTNASPVSVLDSPKNIGRLPAGRPEAVTFSMVVDSTATSLGQVCLRMELAHTGSGQIAGRERFAFTHAVAANRASLHYSTDFPAGSGGTIHRDLNRTLILEPNDEPGLTLGTLDESIEFSSWFPGSCSVSTSVTCTTAADCPATESCEPPSAASVTNLITAGDEAYPHRGDFTHDPGGDDPAAGGNANGILDRHVLVSTNPNDTHLIPWNFDAGTDLDGDGIVDGHGGWYTVRDASSKIGNSTAAFPLWHHVDNGVCGFQTTSATNCVDGNGNPGFDSGSGCVTPLTPAPGVVFGAWHTGSGVVGECSTTTTTTCYRDSDCPATEQCLTGSCSGPGPELCLVSSDCPATEICVQTASDNPACSNYGIAFNPSTARAAEYLFDYLLSPVMEKINQSADKSGFDYTVEFQRLAFNETIQLRGAEPYLLINIDNDLDSNNPAANITTGVYKGDGFTYYITAQRGPIDPYYSVGYTDQVTMGPTTDPDGSLLAQCSITLTSCSDDADCTNCNADKPTCEETCGGTWHNPTATCDVADVCASFLSGDETGFPGFDRSSTNPNAVKPSIPVGPTDLRPFPGPGEVHVGRDDVAGPSRGFEIDLNDYEDNGLQLYTPGDAGDRFQIAFAFLVAEGTAGSGDGDFGVTLDDVVFEWDEVHPIEDSGPCTGGAPLEGPSGVALVAGHRCSTLSADRTNLYDCHETVEVTVNDTRYKAGALPAFALGTPSQDSIQIHVWSNSEPFPGEIVTLSEEGICSLTTDQPCLSASDCPSTESCTGFETGFFRGSVGVSGIQDSPGVVLTEPGTEQNLFFAYEDDDCDSNFNGVAGQSDFDNLDGDGVVPASGRDGLCGTEDDVVSCFGVDGVCGFNPVTGAIDDECPGPTPADNCPTIYNPALGDDDGDHVGGASPGGIYFGCDNCPRVYNPGQADTDSDGVGDECDADDLDGDGVPNQTDNCPETSNPSQNVGNFPPRGQACTGGSDTDGDGFNLTNDNCPLVYNPNQADTDGDPGSVISLGDACDGDCLGECDSGGTVPAGTPCTWGAAHAAVYAVADECGGANCINRVCSTEDDDADADAVPDSFDNCPVTPNPTTLPGSSPPVQADDDFNGIGNECDPAGHFDQDRDGLPDDVAKGPFFAMAVGCQDLPQADLRVLTTLVRDRAELGQCAGGPTMTVCTSGSKVGRACTTPTAPSPSSECAFEGPCDMVTNACGDGDAFADPGEIVRVGLFLENLGHQDLTSVQLAVSTADPDIECVLDSLIGISTLAGGSTLDTRALSPPDDPAHPSDGKFFELVIAPTAVTTNPTQPARGNLNLSMASAGVGGVSSPVPFELLIDLDVPTGVAALPTEAVCDAESAPAYSGVQCGLCSGGICAVGLSGPCGSHADCADDSLCGGVPTACTPGLIHEGFESPGPSPTGTGGIPQNNDFSNTIGFIERNAGFDSNTTMVGVPCFGFVEVFGRTPAGGCQIDPDFDTDWHFEIEGQAPLGKAFRGTKSAHWGRHTNATSRAGDTTPNRQIEAFVTHPVNLTFLPEPGDLLLSFYHIVDLYSDAVGKCGNGDHACDRADVQIQVDLDPGPGESFSRWQKLEPFQNVYDHTTQVFSWFGYCEFTPTDGAEPESPDVFGETMCFPDGVWAHSGNVRGTDVTDIFGAEGPGVLGSVGEGVWVQSKFNLALFVGQRIKIRWIGQGWEFFLAWDSYLEPPAGGSPFDIGVADDGWWVDEIQLTGAITEQAVPLVEPTTIPLTTQCPAGPAENCDETEGSDNGFTVAFTATDSDGDGVVVQGETLFLDASATVNPGGCADGVPQYRFSRDPGGKILQDWSTASSLKLGNTLEGDLYRVEVRCSSDLSCTTSPTVLTVPGGAEGCPVYAGSVPGPVEPPVSYPLSATSSSMVMSMPNYLRTGPGTPPALALPATTFGHVFVRTDALRVAGVCVGGPNDGKLCVGLAGECPDGTCTDPDGGITGSCVGSDCTIWDLFRNVPGSSFTDPANLDGSCDVDVVRVPCGEPGPADITFSDPETPPLNHLFYYLGNTFTTPGTVAKVLGSWGQSRTDGGVGTRSVSTDCP